MPTTFSGEKNIAWRVDLPGRGASSPIVVNGRVILTCSEGVKQSRLIVLCLDAKSGKAIWKRDFWATGRTSTHPTSSVAAPTPSSDGTRIFAFFSSNDLVCLDLDGNLLWYRGLAYDFPKAGNDVGMASSPTVVDETVVVQVENQGDSFATGIDAATGESRWRIARDRRASWASPIAIPSTGTTPSLVLLQSPNTGISAHNSRTGEQLWKYETVCSGIPSPLLIEGGILVSSNGLTKLKLKNFATSPEFDWDSARLRPGNASPVAYKGQVFTVKGGVLSCGRLDTGEKLWQLRLEGNYWATPVLAAGKMYFVSAKGLVKIVDIEGEKGKIVGQGELKGPIQGSPAVSGNALFVRSDKSLWKISDP